MTSILERKIANAANTNSPDNPQRSEACTAFNSLQKTVCASLADYIGEELETADITLVPISAEDILKLDEDSGIAMAFQVPNDRLEIMGHVRAAIPAMVTEHSLFVPLDGRTAFDDYTVTQLDTLLFKPIAVSLCQELTLLFAYDESLSITSHLSFKAMNISKTTIKGLGDLVHVTINMRREIPELDSVSSNTSKAAKSKSAKGAKSSKAKSATVSKTGNNNQHIVSVSLFIPKEKLASLLNLLQKVQSKNSGTVLDPTHPWTIHMHQSLKSANASIRAVLEHREMSVAECTRLEIGQVISLPGISLNSIKLSIGVNKQTSGSEERREIAKGSLGVFKNNRAIKLKTDLDDNFLQNLDLR